MQSTKIETAATNYKTGDVVTLKSDGRRMTATWVGPVAFAPGTWLICEWPGANGVLCLDMFPDSTLQHARQLSDARMATAQ